MAEKIAKRRQEEIFLAALLDGKSIAEAAGQAGISETTAYRWLRSAEFRQRYKQAKEEAVQRVLDKLTSLGEAAINGLGEILTGGENESNRLRACQLVLSMMLESIAYQRLLERVEALEEKLSSGGGTYEANANLKTH